MIKPMIFLKEIKQINKQKHEVNKLESDKACMNITIHYMYESKCFMKWQVIDIRKLILFAKENKGQCETTLKIRYNVKNIS